MVMSRKRLTGFTLVELMITITVITILVAIGYPMYQEQVYKSRRAAARGSLLELAQFMERNYTEANRYDKLADDITDVSLPFLSSPKEGGTAYYDLSLANLTANNYEIRAVPTSVQAEDDCGTLSLSSSGLRDPSDCW